MSFGESDDGTITKSACRNAASKPGPDGTAWSRSHARTGEADAVASRSGAIRSPGLWIQIIDHVAGNDQRLRQNAHFCIFLILRPPMSPAKPAKSDASVGLPHQPLIALGIPSHQTSQHSRGPRFFTQSGFHWYDLYCQPRGCFHATNFPKRCIYMLPTVIVLSQSSQWRHLVAPFAFSHWVS